MNDGADISGAFQRPNPIDYLLVAESLCLDVGLNVHVGRLEVGLIGLRGGRVMFADMPGASGHTALSLLVRLSNARVMVNRWTAHAVNVEAPWRELVGEGDGRWSVGRAQRLAEVEAELRELDGESAADSGAYEIAGVRSVDADAPARRVVAELLDWGVSEAYLGGELEHARMLACVRERVQPNDLLAAANLERLRLRLLEDEFVAGVAEVQE